MNRLLTLLVALLFTGASFAAPWPGPPEPLRVPADTLERLRAGDIEVVTTQLDEAGGAARAMALFHTDGPALWAVIGDCEANLRFVRGLQTCEILREDRASALTHQRLKAYTLVPALDYTFETAREPFEWIRIRLVEGDLRALEGSWRFIGTDDGLLVIHEIRVQPRFPVPRWLARKTLRNDLGDLMACLRWEARAWSDPRQRGRDRLRCPDGGIQPEESFP